MDNVAKMSLVDDAVPQQGESDFLDNKQPKWALVHLKNNTHWIGTMNTNNSTPWNSSDYYYNGQEYMYHETSLELSNSAQIVLITLYTITILLSVVGNLLVIIVLVCGSRMKTELTVFLINLAVADLCMASFCMPFTFTQVMLGRWVFGALMCPLVLFMQVFSVAVSIFTNMAIGIDR